MSLLRTLLLLALMMLVLPNPAGDLPLRGDPGAKPVQLSDEHLAAAGRDRRIIINFDTISGDRNFGGRDPGRTGEVEIPRHRRRRRPDRQRLVVLGGRQPVTVAELDHAAL